MEQIQLRILKLVHVYVFQESTCYMQGQIKFRVSLKTMVTLIIVHVYVFKMHGYITYCACSICGYFRFITCMVTWHLIIYEQAYTCMCVHTNFGSCKTRSCVKSMKLIRSDFLSKVIMCTRSLWSGLLGKLWQSRWIFLHRFCYSQLQTVFPKDGFLKPKICTCPTLHRYCTCNYNYWNWLTLPTCFDL